jgi:hypothetical protein
LVKDDPHCSDSRDLRCGCTSAFAQQAALSRTLDGTDRRVEWAARQSIASFVHRVAHAARVPAVVELDPSYDTVPNRDIDLSGSTVLDALTTLVGVEPRYSWQEMRGVIIVRPTTAWRDERNPLNQPAGPVDWQNVTLGTTLERVLALIYGRPSPDSELPRGARPFSVSVPSGTILDVLVASAGAHGAVVWSTPFTPSVPSALTKFSLGYRSLDHGEDIGQTVGTGFTTLPPSLRSR